MWGGEAVHKAGRVASQEKESLNLDAILADTEKESIRKAANQGSVNLGQDHCERLGVVDDSIKSLFNAKYEVITESRSEGVVPGSRVF